jgi:hypothetical protein
MKTNKFYTLTGSTLLALGLAIAPTTSGTAFAQATPSTVETTDTEATAGQNFEESEEALERAGAEAIQGIEEAGAAAQQDIQEAAQDATRAAQEATAATQQTVTEAAEEATAAAERAELAAERAAENIQEGFDWGWLGLLGLIGLFGLAGGNKRRVEVDDRYRHPNPANPPAPTASSDYR